ncbi:MAG TPA: hypothetical protein VNT60_04580, partial [Deinococcales bacterium]|nr:hypothetical protein [Deinococcales bacterium]
MRVTRLLLLAVVLAAALPVAADGSWARLAPLPAGRAETHAAVIGSTVYLPGGLELVPGKPLASPGTLFAYDSVRGEWRKLKPLPLLLNHSAVTAFGGKLYVMGGASGWPPTPSNLQAAVFR